MEKEQLSLNQRIGKLLKILDISQQEFANKIGSSRQVVSLAIKGPTYPSFNFFKGIAEAYPSINLHWLILGEGDVFLNKEPNNFFNNNVAIGSGNNTVQNSGSFKAVQKHEKQKDALKQETELELLKRENDALRREIELLKDLIDSKDRMIDILTNKKA